MPAPVTKNPTAAGTKLLKGSILNNNPKSSTVIPIRIILLSPSLFEINPEISLPSIRPPKTREPNEAMSSLPRPSYFPAKKLGVQRKAVASPEQYAKNATSVRITPGTFDVGLLRAFALPQSLQTFAIRAIALLTHVWRAIKSYSISSKLESK